MSRTRISSVPMAFVAQINVLDKLQKSQGTPPFNKKYEEWRWTDAESAEVSRMTQKANEFYRIMESKKLCPPEIKDEMKILIREFLNYDHGKLNPHNLLNKIGMFGSITDWEATNVRRGTPLAKPRSRIGSGKLSGNCKPTISLRRIRMREHLIEIINQDAPESKTPPPGYVSTLVFCYIGTDSPVNINQYAYAGKAKRRLFSKSFPDLQPIENTRIYAWYIARYQDSQGGLSHNSQPLKAEIFFPTT